MTNVGAYILIQAKVGTEREVYDSLQELEFVESVHELFGEWDLIAKVATESTEQLDGFISETLRVMNGIKLTSTIVISR